MMRILILRILLSVAALLPVAQAECTKLVFSANPNYPPFHWSNKGKLFGASVELTERALAELGVKAEARYVGPWPRVLKSAELGQIDLVLALKITPEREAFLTFTPARFSTNPMAAFVHKDAPLAYRQWSDLKGVLGGVGRGDRYGEGFDEFLREQLQVVEANNMENGFADLQRQRTRYFITSYQSGMAYLVGKNLDDTIQPLQPMINQGAIHHGFSKLSPCIGILNALSDKLAKYEASGLTERTLAAYLERWRKEGATRQE